MAPTETERRPSSAHSPDRVSKTHRSRSHTRTVTSRLRESVRTLTAAFKPKSKPETVFIPPLTPPESLEDKPPETALDFLPSLPRRGLLRDFTGLGLTKAEITEALDPLLPSFRAANPNVRDSNLTPWAALAERELRAAHRKKYGIGIADHADELGLVTPELIASAGSNPKEPAHSKRTLRKKPSLLA